MICVASFRAQQIQRSPRGPMSCDYFTNGMGLMCFFYFADDMGVCVFFFLGGGYVRLLPCHLQVLKIILEYANVLFHAAKKNKVHGAA